MRRWASAAAVPTGFGLAVVVLSTSGGGELGAPPLGDLASWLERVGPVVAGMAVLRLAALGAATWMLVASLLRAVAIGAGATRLALLAERAMPPAASRVLTGLAGAGAAVVALLGAAGAPATGSSSNGPAVERMVRPPPSDDGTGADDPAPPDNGPTTSMSVVPGAPATADEWVVAPGDSFWSIAEEVVGERLGRQPTAGEVAAYWQRVVAANADRLTSGNADLIYPGQRFLLPA